MTERSFFLFTSLPAKSMTVVFVSAKGGGENQVVRDYPETTRLDGSFSVASVHPQTTIDRLDPSSHAAVLRIANESRVAQKQFGLEVGKEVTIPIGGKDHTFYHSGPRRERAG